MVYEKEFLGFFNIDAGMYLQTKKTVFPALEKNE